MEAPNILKEKRNIIIEVIILCIFLGAMYYGYTLISEQSPTTNVSVNKQLFGPNITLLMKAVEEDKLVLNNISFMDSELVRQLKDFSEIITPNPTHGRDNPFAPK